MRSIDRFGGCIKLVLLVVMIVGMGAKGLGQVAGDFQTKGTTGNWSDYNSWNIRNAANTSWIAATIGQIPSATTDVFIQIAHTITVDNPLAVCKTIDANAATSCKISFSAASSILSVNGNLIFASTGHNIFLTWTPGAKFVFTGNASQATTSLSNSSTFVNLEINKSGNALTTDGDLKFATLLNIVSGTLITGSGKDIQGTGTLSNITIQSTGTVTQLGGAGIFRAGATGTNPIGNLTVNGTLNIFTTTSLSAINCTALNIEDNGITGGAVNVNFTTAGAVITTASGGITVQNNATLNIASTCRATWVAALTALTIQNGGNLNISNNSFTLPTTYSFLGNVSYNDGTQTIAAASSYANLILTSPSSPANKSFTSGLTINKNLLISGNAILLGSSSIVNLAGNWTNYATVGFTESTSTVDFNGAGAQSITTTGGEEFFLIKKTGTGTLTLNSTVKATGAVGSGLNISAGIVDAGTNTLQGGASSTLTMSGGTLKLAKLTTVPEFTGTYSLSAGTIELYGAGAQVLEGGEAYRNLTFSNSTNTTLLSNPASIIGTVYITGSALLDIGSSNGFGDINTNLTMDGGRLKMTGSSTSKPDIDGTFYLTGGVIEFAGSASGAQPIKGKSKGGTVDIIYKNIEVTGTNVGTSIYNIVLEKNNGIFTVKNGGTYAPNSRTIVSENSVNGSNVTVENGAFFKTGNNKGFSGTSYTVPSNSSIDLNIATINLISGSTVDYSNSSVDQDISNQKPYQNFTISGNTTKQAPSTLSILGNFSRTAGTFNPNLGSVSFDGTSAQTFNSVGGSGTNFNAIAINNNGLGVTINSDTLNVIDSLMVSAGSKLILGSGNIALKSTSNKTAHVSGILATSSITYPGLGRFIIERYLYAQKSWRLLSTPVKKLADDVTSPTINDSWREGGISVASTGYGTRVTGPAPLGNPLGVDEITQRSSMKSYSMTGNNYVEINSGNLAAAQRIANDEGYYIFVRGDRGIDVPSGSVGSTTLRMKGQLRTSDETFNVNINAFQSVGNPFPSRIDYLKTTKMGGLEDAFTVWNPTNIGGGYGVGRFEQYKKEIAGPNYTGPFGTRNYIESGEAFFVSSIAAAGSLTIKELDKTNGSANVSRTGVTVPTLEINLLTKDSYNVETKVDGTILNFDNSFSNSLNNEDVKKFSNINDNICILKNNIKLFAERRSPFQSSDTILLNISGMRVADYKLAIDPSVLSNLHLKAYLLDKFLVTETPISLSSVTNVPFSITSNTASRVADRFMIVFRQGAAGPLPVSFTTIAAAKNADKTNTVKWNSTNEINVSSYDVERSTDVSRFTAIGTIAATGNNGNSSAYSFVDVAPLALLNYYRIKAMSASGQIQYSAIVKVVEKDVKPQFTIQPNPVTNKTLHINFDNMVGHYSFNLLSKKGATVFTQQINISNVNEVKNLSVGAVAAGTYDAVLIDAKGKQLAQTVFIQ